MNFSDLKLPSAVAQALATRGYEIATPVQAAVLDDRCIGRDLLVSSQTGSGKTIAFGAAFAQTLLGPRPAAAPAGDGGDGGGMATGGEQAATSASPPLPEPIRPGKGPHPTVLVVVPTRELAAQVRDELGWLLARTGLRMAAFTGGTAVSGDLRALQKGVDLVIGTPGRLCDLLRRGRLELGSVRVVVLDEGDEMLDLGFREDLQTLLQAAPVSRQTLLLSATLPPEIQALARRFQRDALRIDPREGGGAAGASPHADINYVAHLIAAGDRLPVVVNILRAAGTARAIVFCTTREGVSRLHAALLARGFAATAISGDRAQAERDRALEQLRDGDARVLVATNVAARGLHLPDVDLIVHADLPLNAESLTHRSGRTGRAGRKGTAVVIATVSERRKAERLLAAARVPVSWTPPPSAQAITTAARERLVEELVAEAPAERADGANGGAGLDDVVRQLTARLPIEELTRRLLARELLRLPIGEAVHAVAAPPPGSMRDDRGSTRDAGGARGSRNDFRREGVVFRVNLGARQNAEPRWLLPLICRRGGVTSREVGAIRVGPDVTTFEIAGDAAPDFALAAAETDPRAPHVLIARGGDGPDRADPPRRDAKPYPAKPFAAKPYAAKPSTAKPYGAKASTAKPGMTKARDTKPRDAKANESSVRPAQQASAPIRPDSSSVSSTIARPAVAPVSSAVFSPVSSAVSSPVFELPSSVRDEGAASHPDGGHRGARAGRPAANVPSIEMKRAPRHSEAPRHGRAPARVPALASKAPSEPRTARPTHPSHAPRVHADRGRSDGSNVMRRKPFTPPPAAGSRPPFWKLAARPRPSPDAGGSDSPGKKQKDF